MRFYTGIHELIFEDNAQYPASQPIEIIQSTERSAGGVLHVENYNVDPVKRRELVFDMMSEADFIALKDWFIKIAKGALNPFFFEDEDGSVGECRITSNIMDFQESAYKRYSGKMTLEYI